MTRYTYPGGWYIDATPDGAFVVLFPQSHLQTHMGRAELPPGEPWGIGYVRCTGVDGFRFAGQAHTTISPACWEHDGDGWRSFAPPCDGVSPCIYDFAGTLHRSDGSVGSQGYRYVAADGTIMSGDATYRKDLGGGRSLFEYSAAGDLLIGQAAYDGGGVQVWDGTTLRQLELGATTFVRVQVDGEAVSIAFVTPAGAVLIFATLSELRALPPVVPPVEPPEPPDPPVPPNPPVEPPEPPVEPPVEPPQPPYPPVEGVPMQTEHGWLIASGDKVLACDANGVVTYPTVQLTDAHLLELAPIEGDYRGTFTPVAHPELLLTGDATAFNPGGNPCLAYSGAKKSEVVGPDGKPNFYQRFAVGQWDNGIVNAYVPYVEQGANNGRHYGSPSLTWVKKS